MTDTKKLFDAGEFYIWGRAVGAAEKVSAERGCLGWYDVEVASAMQDDECLTLNCPPFSFTVQLILIKIYLVW